MAQFGKLFKCLLGELESTPLLKSPQLVRDYCGILNVFVQSSSLDEGRGRQRPSFRIFVMAWWTIGG